MQDSQNPEEIQCNENPAAPRHPLGLRHHRPWLDHSEISISRSLVFRKKIVAWLSRGRPCEPNANRRRIDFAAHHRHETAFKRGCSSMVEQQPSKLNTRVRFPSPAPFSSYFRTARRPSPRSWPRAPWRARDRARRRERRAHGFGAFDELRHMAVLAVAAADLVGRSDDAGPDRSRGALRDGLPAEGRQACGGVGWR